MGRTPKCADCGSSVCMPVKLAEAADGIETALGYEWLCGSCEYLRAKPYARRVNPDSESILPLPVHVGPLFDLP